MKSLVQFFEENVDKYSSNPYLWEKRDGEYRSTSYKHMREQVHQLNSLCKELSKLKVHNW